MTMLHLIIGRENVASYCCSSYHIISNSNFINYKIHIEKIDFLNIFKLSMCYVALTWNVPFNTIYSIQISYILLNLKSVWFREFLWFKRRIEKHFWKLNNTRNSLHNEFAESGKYKWRWTMLEFNIHFRFSNAMNKFFTSFMLNMH